MTSERAHHLHSQAGYTLIELLTAVAIFAILAAAGLPHLDTRRTDIASATEQVISDYRWTRSRAITGGAHYALAWTAENTYEVRRLKLVGTTWTLDTVVKTGTLPATVIRWGWPDTVEFNTRGMMISTDTTTFQGLWDNQFSSYRMISLWPSGQVNEYD